MPIYEYKCSKCSHKYDKREGFDASPVQKCPECGGKAQRVIHAPPIVFKGSGFYITDSRTSASGAESETKSESKAESNDSKSDSTSDEKTSVAKPKDTKTDSASPAAETPAAG